MQRSRGRPQFTQQTAGSSRMGRSRAKATRMLTEACMPVLPRSHRCGRSSHGRGVAAVVVTVAAVLVSGSSDGDRGSRSTCVSQVLTYVCDRKQGQRVIGFSLPASTPAPGPSLNTNFTRFSLIPVKTTACVGRPAGTLQPSLRPRPSQLWPLLTAHSPLSRLHARTHQGGPLSSPRYR